MKVVYSIEIEAEVSGPQPEDVPSEESLQRTEEKLVEAIVQVMDDTAYSFYPHELPEGKASIKVSHKDLTETD